MNIIQQVIEKITKDYYEVFEKTIKNKDNIGDFILNIKDMLDEVGTILVKGALEDTDEYIRNSRDRKAKWYIERRNESKTLSTIFGDVVYDRTYFKNKSTGEYAYLCDERYGIEPHERMDMSLKAAIVEKSNDLSYAKSIEEFNTGIYSRSTVMNLIREMGPIENNYITSKSKNKPIKELFVEADEDHVATQHNGNKMVKIVYVHEGKRKVSKNRYELINPRYFTSLSGANEDLWLEVTNYIYEAYNIDTVDNIYISGDGAKWIKEGVNWIHKSVFVLDYFHLSKYIKKATAHMEYTSKYMWQYLKSDMKKDVKALFEAIIESTEEPSKKDAVITSKKYVMNNWDAIQRLLNNKKLRCSAEGHVSHVLSDRLSSRPMGWSIEGADQMARLRCFTQNGGKVYEYMKSKLATKKQKEKNIKIDSRTLKKSKRNNLGKLDNLIILNIGKVNPCSRYLKAVRGL